MIVISLSREEAEDLLWSLCRYNTAPQSVIFKLKTQMDRSPNLTKRNQEIIKAHIEMGSNMSYVKRVKLLGQKFNLSTSTIQRIIATKYNPM